MLGLFVEIITLVLPVFLVVAVGYVVRKAGLVDMLFVSQLNRLVFYLALPLLLFYKIANADFSQSFNPQLVTGLFIANIAGCGGAYLLAKLLRYPAANYGTFAQAAFRGNFAYVGLALVFNTYGEAGLAIGGMAVGFVVPLLNFLSILALLFSQQGTKVSAAFILQQVLVNPLIIASFVGIIWSFLDLPIPVVINNSLDIITGMALPLALLAIGASFSLKKLRGDIVCASVASGYKLIFMPLFTAIVLFAVGVRGQALGIGILYGATPTATAAYIFAQQMKGDAELSGAVIMMTTLASVLTYTVTLILMRYYGL